MDLAPFAKKRKAGLTTTDGRASPLLVTYIKSLAAPFLVTQTGEFCERFQLAPGAIYTLGRSKKACDIAFLDTRVSRQHCQLYMFPQNNAIALLDGAVPDAAIPSQLEAYLKEKRRRFPAKENKRLRAIDRRLQGTRIQGFKSEVSRKEKKKSPQLAEISSRNGKVCAIDGLLEGTRIRDVNTEGPRERNLSVDLLFSSNRRSLNGIFVNGNLIDSRSCRALSSGDEVSLVGPTKAGQSLDMNCHVAVGFTVETEPSTKKATFAESSASIPSYSIPSYKRKRSKTSEMVSDSAVDRIASAAALTGNSIDNADKVKDNKSKTPNLATHTEEKRAQRDSSVERERLYYCSKLPEVDSQSCEMEVFVRADCRSEERCSGVELKTDELGAELLFTPDHGKAETLDARDAGIPSGKVSSFPATIETFESTVTKKVRKTTETCETSNVSSEWLDLDNQLASTVNLIQASARLRSFVSDILNNCNTGNASKCHVALQPMKAKEECLARRDTSSLNETVWALQTSRESLLESPLFLCGFASSLRKKVSAHPMWRPGNGTQSACRYISIGKPTLEKTKDASYDTAIEHQRKIRRSPPEFPSPLLRTVLTKEMQIDTEIKVSSCKELSICEERNSQLGAFPSLEREQLHEWSLCLGRTTDDSRLSGKEFKTDLVADLTHLTRTSMAAEIMIRDVQTDFSKGTLTSKAEPYAVVVQGDKYKPAMFTHSEFSDQRGFQDATIAMLASYKEIEKEIGKNRPCNAGMSSAAMEIFEIRKERHIFDSRQISAEGFPDKHREMNSEIMHVSCVRSSGNSDDICPLTSEDQIGEVEADVANVRTLAEGKEISGWKADFLRSSSPTADDKELLTGQILCISALLDTAKDPDVCSVDCNHITSASQQALQRSPVSRIFSLQNTSEMKDNRFVKDHSVEPVGASQVNGNTGRNEGLSCALPDAEIGSLTLCQVESAEIACCFHCSQASLPDVIEEAVLLCAPKLQSEPANDDLNRMLGAGIPTLHMNYQDDKLSVEMCEGRDTQLQHTDNASRKHVNLEVDPCSNHKFHILMNTISERALSKKDVDDDLIQSDLHQMTSIALTNSACTVGHINQERHGGKLEWSERLQVRGACVDQGICLDSIIKDQINKDIKTEDLHACRSLVDRSRSSGFFLNQLKDLANEGSVSHNSISIQDLLSPVDDLDAVFIATFTYDLPWFLSFAGFSRDIPVTVACHDADRCWSQSREDRCERPYLDWPNVTLVYPPFPNACAFAKGSKRRGIGCHHPKLFLLRRKSSIRVIISSANLTPRQWFAVSNNVWCQDFPVRGTSDFKSLFQEGHSGTPKTADFALQLATFIAALVFDCPSEAHWVTDLADFDFSSAAGSLVASVPGLHHPLYHNSPDFLISLEMGSSSHFQNGDSWSPRHLGVVNTAVVGITYRFRTSADPKGIRIRALAAILNEASAYVGLTMPVLLKRAKYVTADPNAVSVVVTSKAKGCSQDLFLQEDLNNADIHTLESNNILQSEEDFVKLGFLPRDVASWLAVLCDRGFCSFAACIWPKEALSVASGQTNGVVKLALYVFQGPRFSELSTTVLKTKEVTAFCGLLKSLHRSWGLWRLERVLSKYNWQDSEESDFFFGASAIGTSLDAKFLAAFAAASGRRAIPSTWSQESDPEWGCWTAGLEADNPSIGIVFPTIERVQRDNFAQFGLLCFAESAWERLKSAHLFYDAVPCSPEREGFPMHAKVARRRFQKSPSSRPYGWFYCGSHNFSPAAWGRPSCRPMDGEAATDAGIVLGSTLHIANYEIGIVLVEPPPPLTQQSIECNDQISEFENETERRGLDRFMMPFKMPPPKYKERDRPATGKAMYEAFMELKALELIRGEEDLALLHSEAPLEGEGNHGEADLLAEEEVNSKGEAEYVEALWSQIENPGS